MEEVNFERFEGGGGVRGALDCGGEVREFV